MLYKPRWGAFYRTSLESHLRGLDVSTLVFSGCNFPNCPRTSIYQASERDFRGGGGGGRSPPRPQGGWPRGPGGVRLPPALFPPDARRSERAPPAPNGPFPQTPAPRSPHPRRSQTLGGAPA
ncbi:hypothetical protein, partial [Endothiovibrio diazotrophicus]